MRWLVVGLGNPGPRYHPSRHNSGFLAAESISARRGIPLLNRSHHALWGEGWIGPFSVIISKPQTFMNLSGLSVRSMVQAMAIDDAHLIVMHDDMDLPLAGIRIRENGGSGGHRGVQSVMDHLGTQDFLRIRIGIGHPDPDRDPAEFVLEPFLPHERENLLPLISEIDQMVEIIIKEGPQAAMNRFNH